MEIQEAIIHINPSELVKQKTKNEINYIPSFMASSKSSHIITNVSNNNYKKINKIISFYRNQIFSFDDDDDIILLKQNKGHSKFIDATTVSIPGFNEVFETLYIFEPIMIETVNRSLLCTNLELLIKKFITSQNIVFERDVEFSELKKIYKLKIEDVYTITKKDIKKLQNYCASFDKFNYFGTEKFYLGDIVGTTSFRVNNILYEVINKNSITSKDFQPIYIYALMIKEILNIKIKKLILISPLTGEEHVMNFEVVQEYLTFVKNIITC